MSLFVPAGSGQFPGVVVSHGAGGSASGYSSNIARTMRGWNMVAIATNYTHAPDSIDAGSLPQGGDGASTANVQRAHKARDLLSCLATVDFTRLAAHGHSMGAFVTGQLHHGVADTVVDISLDRTFDGILTGSGTPHEFVVYPACTHEQMALDALMLERVREWYLAHGVLMNTP